MSDPLPPPQTTRLDIVGLDDRKTPAHGLATPPYVQRKIDELAAALDAALKTHDNKLTWRSVFVAVGAVAAGVVAMIIFVDNRVMAETDAGVKVHETRITALEQTTAADRAQNNTRFQRIEDGQLRTDKKLDALLDKLNVPNPAPAPKDGGP